jgi:predicted PhzF superfamily epimerase YddE/YHI9
LVYDVFSGELQSGNPCGVVMLDEWLTDTELLQLSQQLGQPVTSFLMESNGQFQIRWFSLESEINLCGHGSLGAGSFLITEYQLNSVELHSEYGTVTVQKRGEGFGMTLPAWKGEPCVIPDSLNGSFMQVDEVFSTRDLVIVLPDEQSVANFLPDQQKIMQIRKHHALIVTASSGDSEYVLRYFAPNIGIDEDLATGSAQCSLAPYWFDKLGVETLSVRQLSKAGGLFRVEKASDSLITIIANVTVRA